MTSQKEVNGMSLRDQIAKDIDRIFLTDFAEQVIWNGKAIKAVVQDEQVEDSEGHQSFPHFGVGQHRVRVYLKASDINRPKPNEFIEFDEELWRVISTENHMGLLKVNLEQKQQ